MDEKKLDEKMLEEITGGNGIPSDWTREDWAFVCYNCLDCRHEGPGTCPYGTDKPAAFRKEGATCHRKEQVQ